MIYIDEIQEHAEGHPNNRRCKKWCHLVTDGTLEELHSFAEIIGIKSKWYSPDKFQHYDLTESKRNLALENGAIEIESRHAVKMFIKPTLDVLIRRATWKMATTKQSKFTFSEIRRLSAIYDKTPVQIAQMAARQMKAKIRVDNKSKVISFIGLGG